MSRGEDERKARLAQALRENLRRRKGQAREGAAEAGRERESDGAPASGEPASEL